MTSNELFTTGLKLLGAYFLIEGICGIWQAINTIIIAIIPSVISSGNGFPSFPWSVALTTTLYPITAIVSAFLLLRRTSIFFRISGLQKPTSELGA